jgi:type VI secretion system protein ImpC
VDLGRGTGPVGIQDVCRAAGLVGLGPSRVRRLAARYLGLALPRFLLRLPYGPGGETADAIDFAEVGEAPSHEDYLWGSPAIACALLLAESFGDSGWGLRPGERLDIEDLPLHVVRAGGEPTAQPCAETLLTERAALRILESGLMPLASLKGRDAVRLVRFQSIAEPAAPLAGRWGGAADVARA